MFPLTLAFSLQPLYFAHIVLEPTALAVHRKGIDMKAVFRTPLLAALCVSALALLGCIGEHTYDPPPQGMGPMKAGMAEVDITPPIGCRVAGQFEEHLSTSVHDPLKAKALVLQQGPEKIAMVFCDLVGLDLAISTNARAMAGEKTGIPVGHIVIAATHSHTGPLFNDIRESYFHRAAIARYGEDPHETVDYPKFLISQIVKAIVQANNSLAPAELDAGIGTQPGLAFNRRYHMRNGKVAFNPGLQNPNVIGPAGPTDPDVGILIVKDRKRKDPIGGLTVFAMHCDTAGGEEISADYPYFIQQTLREKFGPEYVSAFGAGTCGDINHIDVSKTNLVKGFDVSERLGATLGKTVLADVPQLKPITAPSLAVGDETLTLPLQVPTPEQLAEAEANIARMNDTNVNFYTKVRAVKALDLKSRGTTWPAEVQVFRLDHDTAIVCLPAEIFVEFGLAIKKASPFKQTMVITICNDRPSYVPTIKAFKEGSYEVVNSRFRSGSGEEMVKTAIKLLNELKE
jgi:hypothetical protein